MTPGSLPGGCAGSSIACRRRSGRIAAKQLLTANMLQHRSPASSCCACNPSRRRMHPGQFPNKPLNLSVLHLWPRVQAHI